jgi:hypothetical protein
VDNAQILDQIRELVAAEHDLRSTAHPTSGDSADARARLREIEESLDQCWDLLRQRRARREFGEDPAGAQVRPVGEVEGYRQ